MSVLDGLNARCTISSFEFKVLISSLELTTLIFIIRTSQNTTSIYKKTDQEELCITFMLYKYCWTVKSRIIS